jgi:hypothetical protein
MGLLDEQRTALREPATCPFLREPCRQDACNMWVTYRRADGQVYTGCAFVFLPVLLGETIVELQRNQASADKVATEVHRGFAGLTRLAFESRRLAALADGDA